MPHELGNLGNQTFELGRIKVYRCKFEKNIMQPTNPKCSHGEHHSCEINYLKSIVHLSPVAVPLCTTRLWSAEEGGIHNVECVVWSVEYGVWSAKCGVWSAKCGVWSVECVEFVVCVECEVQSVKCRA